MKSAITSTENRCSTNVQMQMLQDHKAQGKHYAELNE